MPPVPVPAENPMTEPKRVLGKILFWDEQLSSDDTIACGTCHRPAFGGADPRSGRHPGVDKGTIDDVHGSPGIVAPGSRRPPEAARDVRRSTASHSAPSTVELRGAVGRGAFLGRSRRHPVPGPGERARSLIARGGALENQALSALINDTEMAQPGARGLRSIAKLERACR